VNPILGVDFGKARIGLAISDELRWLAHALETVTAASDAVKRIARIVRERKIDIVVVGIPKTMRGEIGKSASEAFAFVKKLRAALPCEVVTWDERLTTTAAQRALRQAGKKVRATRQIVDQVAAQMILQGYLDRQHKAVPAEEISG
jgi:putative holliday junction resolvase